MLGLGRHLLTLLGKALQVTTSFPTWASLRVLQAGNPGNQNPKVQVPQKSRINPLPRPLLLSSCAALVLSILLRENVTCVSATYMSLKHSAVWSYYPLLPSPHKWGARVTPHTSKDYGGGLMFPRVTFRSAFFLLLVLELLLVALGFTSYSRAALFLYHVPHQTTPLLLCSPKGQLPKAVHAAHFTEGVELEGGVQAGSCIVK